MIHSRSKLRFFLFFLCLLTTFPPPCSNSFIVGRLSNPIPPVTWAKIQHLPPISSTTTLRVAVPMTDGGSAIPMDREPVAAVAPEATGSDRLWVLLPAIRMRSLFYNHLCRVRVASPLILCMPMTTTMPSTTLSLALYNETTGSTETVLLTLTCRY